MIHKAFLPPRPERPKPDLSIDQQAVVVETCELLETYGYPETARHVAKALGVEREDTSE